MTSRSFGTARGSQPHGLRRLAVAVTATALLLHTTASASADTSTAAALPDRIIDVVQVTWAGAATPAASAESVARTIQQDTIARWRKISNGQIVFTFGQTLPTIQTRIQLPCDAASTIDYMNAVQTAAYQRAGITKWDSRYLVIVSPRPNPDCVWDGRGVVNPPTATSGRLILKDTDDRTVIAHELGHNLGLGHSNLEKCADGRADGPWEDCTAVEYGSATDLMSNNDRSSQLSAYHQWRMGWIADKDVALGNTNKTVTLNPVDTTTGTRAIFLRDASAAYWVEYRKADPENQIDAGLVIYRSDPPPATSVESPLASDKSDPKNSNVTTDVWMISLGTYRYSTTITAGSPSLAAGKLFTTAFGGASLIATENADSTVSVSISRNNTASVPSTPEFSDETTWRTPDTLLLEPTLDDYGVEIAYFEARMTSNGATTTERVQRADSVGWSKTYLSPIAAPANVRLGDLPEGNYALQLRAVNTLGGASAWSPTVQVKIDRGAPIVTSRFTQVVSKPGAPVTLRWSGVTDKGSGICQVQVFNEDGFALYKWVSDEAGVPEFAVPPAIDEQRDAVVYDCLGNGVAGTLAFTTTSINPTAFKRTGTWRTSSSSLRCVGSCTATFKTSGSNTAITATGSALAVSIDGKRVKTSSLNNIGAGKTVRITGRNLTLSPPQQLQSSWTQTSTLNKRPFAIDSSLDDPVQLALSQLGFSQTDFSDTHTVLPLSGGTGLQQATLDLCSPVYESDKLRISRRQVSVSQNPERFVFLSTETVQYRDAAAVQQALKEIDEHVAKCKADGFALNSAGAKQPHEFLELPQLPTGLVPAKDRRIYLVNIGESGTATTLLAAYQFSGDILNALYVVVEGKNGINAAAQTRWLNVAALLAQRLVSNKP